MKHGKTKQTLKTVKKVGRPCLTCLHDKRLDLDREILAGVPVAQLSREYGISAGSIFYHRNNHLTRQLLKSKEIKDDFNMGVLASDFQDYHRRLNLLLDAAEEDKQTHSFIQVLTEIRQVSEFTMKLFKTWEDMQGEQDKQEAQECPCGGEYVVHDLSEISDERLSKILKILAMAKDSEGRPIISAPIRETLH